MHMIVDHGDEFTVYLFSPMRIPFFLRRFLFMEAFWTDVDSKVSEKDGVVQDHSRQGLLGLQLSGALGNVDDLWQANMRHCDG